MARTLILGAGFGGIASALTLRELAPEHEVVLVDASDTFSMGIRKLWELAGIGSIADGSRSRARLLNHGVEFVHARVSAIDPAAKSAIVGHDRYEADHVIVALGAVQRPDLVPGLADHSHDIWNRGSVQAARRSLEAFSGGRLLICVTAAPYPCPPAPYECAMLLDEYFRRRGIRDAVEIATATPQPILMPNAGGPGSQWVAGQLYERGILHSVKRKLVSVSAGVAHFEDGDQEFDVMLAVPPHRVPEVVAAAGLAGRSGWIEVDRDTLATPFNDVYAIGDVTTIKLANGLPLPKAGVIAEREGQRVGTAIAARLTGAAEPEPFAGVGMCFVETCAESAALIDGRFFAEPEPDVQLLPATPEHAALKRQFETERLAAWFGG